jgi:penicillin-binding protein 1A
MTDETPGNPDPGPARPAAPAVPGEKAPPRPAHATAPETPDFIKKYGPPAAKVAGTLFAVGLVTFGLLWNTMFAQMPQLPSRDTLWTLNRESAVEFVDAKGETIAVRGPRYGRAVRLSALPDHVVNAFIAAEDRRFLAHEGVDYSAIFRATLENVRAGRTVQGGSTITQQLVKNLFLTPDQTLRRKAQEARLAIDLERQLGKQEILELYLNRIYLGAGAYGLDAAAHTFFGVAPADLTLAQAAVLASFPKAPSRYARDAGSTVVKERQHYVLDRMVEARFITPQQSDAAKRQTLEFATEDSDSFAGHALDYAVQQVHDLLPNPPPDLVVQLTIDLKAQTAAQDAVTDGIRDMGASRNASEAAAVVMDHTGAIRAMVGGTDYSKSKFNRAVQARRQPGSSFKMFVWAAALEAGLRPGSVRYDEPIQIGGWRPRNYGGGYRGAVTLSEALAESLNTVSAAIGAEIGVSRVTDLARRFGIRTQLHNYPSVTLGSDVVTLLDMTTGYGVLAKGGLQMSPYIVQEIRNSRGDVLYAHPTAEAPRIYAEDLSLDMTGMLSRVVVQGTGRAAHIPGWDVAGKTGTSQDWRDAWFIGYNGLYVGGIWVGNDNDAPMAKITGGEMSARMWAMMMTKVLDGVDPVPLPGAKQVEEFLSVDDQNRLGFYRRLSAAFRSVEARGASGEGGPG